MKEEKIINLLLYICSFILLFIIYESAKIMTNEQLQNSWGLGFLTSSSSIAIALLILDKKIIKIKKQKEENKNERN